MESDDGFRSFSHAIESDPLGVLLAKWRQDAFIGKLEQLPDVVEVIPSGSLTRGTQIGRIHDVDLIVVFDKAAHPDFGRGGPESAQAAMTYLQGKLLEQLHPLSDDLLQDGAGKSLVKDTEQRSHVVTCRGGWIGEFTDIIPSAPPVDVMPAVQEGSHLLVPERGTGWIDADPQRLIRQVAQRQREWKYITEVARMVKAWAEHERLGMKSLAIEVMVLRYCPRPRAFETLSCGEAVARFFEAAAGAHITTLRDPAGRYGEIDPKINYGRLRERLDRAAELARQAMDAEHAWDNRRQISGPVAHPDVFWRELFGRSYLRAKVRFLPSPASEPASRRYGPAPAAPPGWGALGPRGPADHGLRGPEDPGPHRPPGGGPRPPRSGPYRREGGYSSPDVPDDTEGTRRSPGQGGEAPGPDTARPGPAAPGHDGDPPESGSGPGGPAPHDSPRRRYLKSQCPESIPVGMPFSLLVSIVVEAGPGLAQLKPFAVPADGSDVLLVAHAPGLRLLGNQRLTVHVPAEENSDPVMFELRADRPGPQRVSITAWIDGSYLGELLAEITAVHGVPPGLHREVFAEIAMERAEGALSLVVRHDPIQNAYRFEFLGDDYPGEVVSNLVYEPGPLVEKLIRDLDQLAEGRTGYSPEQAKFHLQQAGARLWSELVPAQLREQFWERQHRIRQLTILADKDTVPWELLYPADPGHDAGFLVEQFPVMRSVFRWRPSRTLNLRPARFVVSDEHLPQAQAEIDALRRLLDDRQSPIEAVPAFAALQQLIDNGEFGLLHFACHNRYDQGDGCSIKLGNMRYTPMLMTTAAINKVLARCAPTIFMNACRSAGLHATYNRLDGWASKFLEAGAAAFVGTLWAVSDEAAREFAEEFYRRLQDGTTLGEAVMLARHQVAHSHPDDPTWLAYTAYGDPRATVTPAGRMQARRTP